LAVKNVGENFVKAVIAQRKENGPYLSIQDFVTRVNSKDLNKKSLESLIKSGAFDRLEERAKLLSNLDKLLEYARETQKNKANGQKGLFDNSPFKATLALAQTNPAASAEKLTWEKELLGLYVSGHPLNNFKGLKKKATPITKITREITGKNVRVAGVVSNVKKIITKRGQVMLFMGLEDQNAKIEIVVFPSALEKNPGAFQENKIVFITGRVDFRDGAPKIICNDIEEIIEVK
jgi:DNA polymerase-3 subunit alpha